MYTLPIKHPNIIEFTFSNLNSTLLNLEYIDLIAEKEKSSETFKIELFLINTKNRSFVIPEQEKELRIGFEFIYEELGSFEIIGLFTL